MMTVRKVALMTVYFSCGVSLLGCAIVYWLEGEYGRSPAAVALGAAGWMLAGLQACRSKLYADTPDSQVLSNNSATACKRNHQ